MTDTPKKKPGRKPMTPEQRAAGIKATKAKMRAKTKNVTLDADLLAVLGKVQDRMEAQFGFRPTYSQTIRNLATMHEKESA